MPSTFVHMLDDPPLRRSSGILPVIGSIFGLGADEAPPEGNSKPRQPPSPARPPQGLVPKNGPGQSRGMAAQHPRAPARDGGSQQEPLDAVQAADYQYGLHEELPVEVISHSADGELPCYNL